MPQRPATDLDPTALFLRFCRHRRGEDLAVVFDRTAPELMRVATHLVGDVAVAEDLVQSTFLTAMEKSAAFRRGERVMPWLMGILQNRVKRHRESRARRLDMERLGVPTTPEGPFDSASRRELDQALSDAIRDLPALYRPVVRLHLRHGLSPGDIAVDLGRAPATVRKQLQRGLERVREVLPVGFVMIGACAPRGLAAVRAELLSQVPGAAVGGVAAGFALIGVVSMKQVAIVVLLCIAGLWAVRVSDPDAPAVAVASPASQPAADAVAGGEPARPSAAASERQRLHRTHGSTAEQGAEDARPSLCVRGRVETAEGEPVAGAAVYVEFMNLGPRPEHPQRSDARGEFCVEAAPLGQSVFVLAPGFAASRYQIVEGQPDGEQQMTFVLRAAGAVVQGRVLGREGEPVAGAEIWVGQHWSNRYLLQANTRIAVVPGIWLRSDAQGRFATTSAQLDSTVFVQKSGYASQRVGLAGRNRRALEISLLRGAVLEGQVFGADGKPLPGAVVEVVADAARPSIRWPQSFRPATQADDAGRYRLECVPPRETRCQVRGPGHLVASKTFSLRDEVAQRWDPVLKAAPRVRGRVVDDLGRALAGFGVACSRAGQARQQARSDTGGSFAFDVEADQVYAISVMHPDTERWGPLPLVIEEGVASGRRDLVLRVDRRLLDLGSARGVIRNADGTPAGRVECCLWREPYQHGKNVYSEAPGGELSLPKLPAGRYRLGIRAPRRLHYKFRFAVRPGEATHLDDLTLHDPASLSVELRDTLGAPFDGVGIKIMRGSRMEGSIRIEDGRGGSKPLPAGEVQLRLRGMLGFPELEPIHLEWGRTKLVHLQLPRGYRRRFHFKTAAERALRLSLAYLDERGARVVRPTQSWPAGMRATESQVFAVGTYILQASEPGKEPVEHRFTVRPDGPADLEIEIPLR